MRSLLMSVSAIGAIDSFQCNVCFVFHTSSAGSVCATLGTTQTNVPEMNRQQGAGTHTPRLEDELDWAALKASPRRFKLFLNCVRPSSSRFWVGRIARRSRKRTSVPSGPG